MGAAWLRRSIVLLAPLLHAPVLLAPIVLAACNSENLPSDLRFQTAHFEYYSRASDDTICPDLAGPLEDHFATLQSYFGFDWPAGRKVKYYKFTDTADFTANNRQCPDNSGGCTDQNSVVQSPNGLDTHELVHAYLFADGDPPNVLIEGAAVALSCTSNGYPEKPTETWDQLADDMFSSKDTVTIYRDGAWLVGYLLDVFGPQPFMTLYETLKSSADATAMDAAFQTIYGQSLASIWAAALTDSQPRNVCVWQCSRPPIALDGTAFDTTGVCGTDSQRPFTLTAESVVSFATSGADLQLGPCGQIDPPTSALNGTFPSGGVTALYDLPAGTYYLDHNPLRGTITAGLAPGALNPACTSATDVAALSNAAMLYVAVPSSQQIWFLPLRAPLADGAQPVFEPVLYGDGYADVCDGCDLASCTGTGDILPPWASGQVVRYTSTMTRPYDELMLFWE
ncbi:MAG TPA: hypothetical protein VGP64_16745 [Polyangia bacterium]